MFDKLAKAGEKKYVENGALKSWLGRERFVSVLMRSGRPGMTFDEWLEWFRKETPNIVGIDGWQDADMEAAWNTSARKHVREATAAEREKRTALVKAAKAACAAIEFRGKLKLAALEELEDDESNWRDGVESYLLKANDELLAAIKEADDE